MRSYAPILRLKWLNLIFLRELRRRRVQHLSDALRIVTVDRFRFGGCLTVDALLSTSHEHIRRARRFLLKIALHLNNLCRIRFLALRGASGRDKLIVPTCIVQSRIERCSRGINIIEVLILSALLGAH